MSDIYSKGYTIKLDLFNSQKKEQMTNNIYMSEEFYGKSNHKHQAISLKEA